MSTGFLFIQQHPVDQRQRRNETEVKSVLRDGVLCSYVCRVQKKASFTGEPLGKLNPILEDQGSIRNHVVEFSERLYSDPVPWRPTLDGLKFQRLGTDQASALHLFPTLLHE
ncbi:hypothetical protein Sjap_025805 [Stephania japonica]|uniref:Uncharacterized protein n=1 Tax=Stephania japonica TaxID=461633 RepID=A0AAP0HFY7_9MAGN